MKNQNRIQPQSFGLGFVLGLVLASVIFLSIGNRTRAIVDENISTRVPISMNTGNDERAIDASVGKMRNPIPRDSKQTLVEQIDNLGTPLERRGLYLQWCRENEIAWEDLWDVALKANFGNAEEFSTLLLFLFDARANLDNKDDFMALILEDFGKGKIRDELAPALLGSLMYTGGSESIGDMLRFADQFGDSFDQNLARKAILRGMQSEPTESMLGTFKSNPEILDSLLTTPETVQAFSNLLSLASFSNREKRLSDLLNEGSTFLNASNLSDQKKDQILINISANHALNDPDLVWKNLVENLSGPEEINTEIGRRKMAGIAADMVKTADPSQGFQKMVDSNLVPPDIQRKTFSTWVGNDGGTSYKWFEESKASLPPPLKQQFLAGFADAALQRGEIETAKEWIGKIDDVRLKEELEGIISNSGESKD